MVAAAGRQEREGQWPIVKAAIAIVAGAQELILQVGEQVGLEAEAVKALVVAQALAA